MTVREFLYVDVERSRALLAQLDRGVLDSVVERTEETTSGDLAAKVLGVGGSIALGSQTDRSESRSMQDLTFIRFEELAEKSGYLLDLGADELTADAWRTGTVHSGLTEGQLIRITTDLQVLDPRFFVARVTRFSELAEALASMRVSDALPTQQRKAALKKAQTDVWGDASAKTIENIAAVVSSMLGGAIAIRVCPCGLETPELSFGGVLLDRQGYLQEEREALFGLYGTHLVQWTAVMQIASLPVEPIQRSNLSDLRLIRPDQTVDRARLESGAGQLIQFLEQSGLAEGPRWPSISVVPLGIYRVVPMAS